MNETSFAPLSIGKNEIKNRFIMGSMHTGLEELPNGFEAMAAYFAERAKGEVGLIITGGVSPNNDGRLWPGAICFNADEQISKHQIITHAVHDAGGKIAMQILHAGRYGVHDKCVSASAIQAPINIYTPRALSVEEIQTTIQDFANCARRAEEAGYDGIEIMGSEGYFLHQFIAPRIECVFLWKLLRLFVRLFLKSLCSSIAFQWLIWWKKEVRKRKSFNSRRLWKPLVLTC
jgi:2,4-dienoyl-CoA reductase (NADPH2)